MSNESKLRSILTVPKWDGKVETCMRYLAQITALVKFYNFSNTVDATIMATCLVKLEFNMIDPSANNLGEVLLRKLNNANKCILVIMTLGINSNHGLVVIQGH